MLLAESELASQVILAPVPESPPLTTQNDPFTLPVYIQAEHLAKATESPPLAVTPVAIRLLCSHSSPAAHTPNPLPGPCSESAFPQAHQDLELLVLLVFVLARVKEAQAQAEPWLSVPTCPRGDSLLHCFFLDL